MLHSVRYLQSQWNARSPELSLKDLVEVMRPGASPAPLDRARRHYQACRIQCFLRGVAVAVDGPLPSSGAVLIGAAEDPDYIVGSVRPSFVLGPADLAAKLPTEAELPMAAEVLAALRVGLLVYVRATAAQECLVAGLRELAKQHRYPVLDIELHHNQDDASPHPLALREVMVKVSPSAISAVKGSSPRVH
jgi:hypothetical protein